MEDPLILSPDENKRRIRVLQLVGDLERRRTWYLAAVGFIDSKLDVLRKELGQDSNILEV